MFIEAYTGAKDSTVCLKCSHEYVETLEKLGHDFSSEWTVEAEPTCTSIGVKTHHCTRCDAVADTTQIAPLGHDFSSEWTVDVEPTCTTTGTKSHHCTRCSAISDSTVIEAIAHDLVHHER